MKKLVIEILDNGSVKIDAPEMSSIEVVGVMRYAEQSLLLNTAVKKIVDALSVIKEPPKEEK